MRAFLLAAGLGTRLKPITDTIPKCLVEVAGHPMLDWWAKLFQENNVDRVLVNTHYLADKVHKYIQSFNKKSKRVKFIESYEPVLPGSGGTVKLNEAFVADQEDFLICYADNLTNINLKEFINFHKSNKAILTMALFRANNPEQCGVAVVDKDNRITEFVEKPAIPKTNLANAGIYVAGKDIFNYFPDAGFIDFGRDILPKLAGKMYGYKINDYLIDIGTMENYKKAQVEWKYDYYKDSLTY